MNSTNRSILSAPVRGSGGFALLMVLMLIVTAAVVGISYIHGAQVKTASTGNLMQASRARYLAESGLQHGLYALQTQATPFGAAAAPNGPYHVDPGDGGYVFYMAATSTPGDYRIVASGSQGAISQEVSARVRLSSQYAEKVRQLAPRYWWRLGDSDLTARDEQGIGDGTYVNAVTRGVEGALFGDVDTAAEFRGGNDYVSIDSVEDMDYARITFGCWVRADAWASSYPRIISRASGYDTFDRRWELALDSSRTLRFTLRVRDVYVTIYGNKRLELGQWYFIVATFNKDARRMQLFLDGESDATGTNSVLDGNIRDSAGVQAWIGDCPPAAGERAWDGPIDEVFIIKDVAMTPEQVKELYDAATPGVKVVSWDD